MMSEQTIKKLEVAGFTVAETQAEAELTGSDAPSATWVLNGHGVTNLYVRDDDAGKEAVRRLLDPKAVTYHALPEGADGRTRDLARIDAALSVGDISPKEAKIEKDAWDETDPIKRKRQRRPPK